jgi:D-alanyl-D-alanine carboxypeptidase
LGLFLFSAFLVPAQERPPAFWADLSGVRDADAGVELLILVDKTHPLPVPYVPKDLVTLTSNDAYLVNRSGLQLRSVAEAALRRMGAAAKQDGVTLVASSTYRSYDYQVEVYGRHVKNLGALQADRISARPGTSQHQLGTVVDFGSIDDSFAATAAGKWLVRHAGEYGWSLSFPQGFESETGYTWESWHYRYIGGVACAFQARWFNDIQQRMMEYLNVR